MALWAEIGERSDKRGNPLGQFLGDDSRRRAGKQATLRNELKTEFKTETVSERRISNFFSRIKPRGLARPLPRGNVARSHLSLLFT